MAFRVAGREDGLGVKDAVGFVDVSVDVEDER